MSEHQELQTLLTDRSNSERLVKQEAGKIRYCPAWKKWLVWDGERWAIDDTNEIELRAKETIRSMYEEAKHTEDTGRRRELANHAVNSEYIGRIRAMVTLAESEPGIPVRPNELDSDPYLLNCLNGTIDLRTGRLVPHDPAMLITKLARVEFDPEAQSPRFDEFIRKITGGDKALAEYLQRAVGYSLTGDVGEQVMFVLYGDGANGKTTFLEAIRGVLGDYAGVIPVETLLQRANNNGVPNDIALLKGRRLVTASEVQDGRRLAEAKVKEITGGGTIQARLLYGEYFTFLPTHKIFMDCNHVPIIGGNDHGIWRRIRLVPFKVSIPEAERDPKLLDKLRAEASGILAWAVRGCLEWQVKGLESPSAVQTGTEAYRETMDTIAQFISEECTLDSQAYTATSVLYRAFTDWSVAKGQADPPSQNAFGKRLGAMGLANSKRKGERGWAGIRLNVSQPVTI